MSYDSCLFGMKFYFAFYKLDLQIIRCMYRHLS